MEIEVKKLYYDKNLIAHINALEMSSAVPKIILKLEAEDPMIRIESNGTLCFLEPENLVGYIQLENAYVPLASSKSIPLPDEVLDLLDTLLEKCTLTEGQLAEVEKGKKLIKRELKKFMIMLQEDSEEITVIKNMDSISLCPSVESFSSIIQTTKFIDGLVYYFMNLIKKELSYNEMCSILEQKLELAPGETKKILASEIATYIA